MKAKHDPHWYRLVAIENKEIDPVLGIPTSDETIHWTKEFYSTTWQSATRTADRRLSSTGESIWQSLYSNWERKNKTMYRKYKYYKDSKFEIRLIRLKPRT